MFPIDWKGRRIAGKTEKTARMGSKPRVAFKNLPSRVVCVRLERNACRILLVPVMGIK